MPVGCLSNSNTLHSARFTYLWDLDRLFDVRLLSHEIGVVKPDTGLFDRVVAELGAPAASVIFLDGNAINVCAAQKRGLTAARVSGPPEARRVLEQLGVLETTPNTA